MRDVIDININDRFNNFVRGDGADEGIIFINFIKIVGYFDIIGGMNEGAAGKFRKRMEGERGGDIIINLVDNVDSIIRGNRRG